MALFSIIILFHQICQSIANSLLNSAFLLTAVLIGQATAICTAPRLRQNWNAMSVSQQRLYLDSVNAMKTTTDKAAISYLYKGNEYDYDDFVNIHLSSVPYAHRVAMFLPWHRKFLKVYEDHILTIAKKIKSQNPTKYGSASLTGIPYYDWAQPQIADNPYKQSSFF